MNVRERTALMDALRRVISSAGGMERAAAALDVKYSTLSKQVCPTDDDHKLGLFDCVDLLDASDDPEPVLSYLAERFGFLLIKPPASEASRDVLLRLSAALHVAEGQLSGDILAATDPAGPNGARLSEEEERRLEADVIHIERVAEAFRQSLTRVHASRRPLSAVRA